MRKIVTMHQPNYLPWIGLFNKIKLGNCFIISDTFKCADITRRSQIRTSSGYGFLTIPLGKKCLKSRICDIKLPDDNKWQDSHWRQIYENYVHTPCFQYYGDFFKILYQKDCEYLSQINTEIILFLLKCFNIEVEIIKLSDLNLDSRLEGTDVIVAALKSVGAQTYLSGPSGRNYLEFEKFLNNNIDLKFSGFEHPVYKQKYPGFIPNLSAIDLLFNMGIESGEIISKSGSIQHS